MIILGIETSCDETALALIETRGDFNDSFECRVIQSLVHSQAELHSAYGGVYPALAKREHSKNLIPLLEKILKDFPHKRQLTPNSDNGEEFNTKLREVQKKYTEANPDLLQSVLNAKFLNDIPAIDLIAVTEGPGLEPALWVGIVFAKTLAELWNTPLVPINHMEGHVIGSLLADDRPLGAWQKLHDLSLPSIAFLISGGHTELVGVTKSDTAPLAYKIIGETKDDAVGEAFDKAARLLGLPYPGGPHLSKLAHEAREKNISAPVKLPRPMIHSGDLLFSFSGLKTAVLYAVKKAEESGNLNDTFKAGLAREFEDAVTETLDSKLRQALEIKDEAGSIPQSLIVGGGVSANHMIRAQFEKTTKEYGIPVFLPSRHISGDNALMIALAAALNHTSNNKTPHASAKPRELKAHGTKRLE